MIIGAKYMEGQLKDLKKSPEFSNHCKASTKNTTASLMEFSAQPPVYSHLSNHRLVSLIFNLLICPNHVVAFVLVNDIKNLDVYLIFIV